MNSSAARNNAAPASHGGADRTANAAAREYLLFKLGAQEYGIDTLKVQEVRGYEAPTRIANAPPFIKGVVNLRGALVPVVDLRIRFGLEDVHCNNFTAVIILKLAGRTVGMVVDAVSDVLELRSADIQPAPTFHGVLDAASITGLCTVTTGGAVRVLALLDIEQLMGRPEMGLHEAVAH